LRKEGKKVSNGYRFWGQNLRPNVDETLKSSAWNHSEGPCGKDMSGGSAKALPRHSGLTRGSHKPKRGSNTAEVKPFSLLSRIETRSKTLKTGQGELALERQLSDRDSLLTARGYGAPRRCSGLVAGKTPER
jgi:hypothetical protein